MLFRSGLDILLITSDHEGLPMTLLESMAIGTAIISANIGGIPFALDKGKCGVLISKATPLVFAANILTAIESTQETIIKSINARARVEHLYSADHNANTIIKLYTCLIKSITI